MAILMGILTIVGFLLIVFIIWFSIFFLFVGKKYKYKLPKKQVFKEDSKVKMILFDFPIRFWEDRFNYVPGTFEEKGFHLVCGEQGSGKTTFAVWYLLRMQEQYPKLKVKTNCFYKYEDERLKSANDLIFSNNGVYGEIDFIDEVQNWFNSLESRDFPIEMLQEISQQRKQHKMIIGTSQVFNRVAKPLREQVNWLYLPITLFGCLTIVSKVKCQLNNDGELKDTVPSRIYMFVHTDKLRDAFDTYHKIEYLSKGGLKQKDWSIYGNSKK